MILFGDFDIKEIFGYSACLFVLALASFALFDNPRQRVNQFLTLSFVSLAMWNLAGLLSVFFLRTFGKDISLIFYRVGFGGGPLLIAFMAPFTQTAVNIYDRPFSRRLRQAVAAYALFYFLVLPTPLVLKDFVLRSDVLVKTKEIPGPLYPVHYLFLVVGFLSMIGQLIAVLRKSSGLRRIQVIWLIAGYGIGGIAIVFSALSATQVDRPWTYFPLQMVSCFCLSYAIFKYQLLGFSLRTRRLLIFVGVFSVFTLAPYALTYIYGDWFRQHLDQSRHFYPLSLIAYGALFSLAPLITTFLRDKSEEKRLTNLRQHLTVIQRAAEQLAAEQGLTPQDIADKIRKVLVNFFWEHVQSPLEFIVVMVADKKSGYAYSMFPEQQIDTEISHDFIASLRSMPEGIASKPFSPASLDLDSAPLNQAATQTVRTYLIENGVEVCSPCVYDGQVYGTLLLGRKKREIFWPDELSTLQMASAQMAVALRNNNLLEQTKELKTLDEYKTDLISDIAHEFKSPLAVMCDAVDILLQESRAGKTTKAKLENYLMMMRRNAERLETFILNLLAAARIQQSKVELATTAADLEEIVQRAVRLHEPLVSKKGLRLSFVRKKAILVNADVEKMQQVFSNLISNAIKFTDQGSITVEVREENGQASVSIRDTGRGIDPRYLSSIFERFFQASPATPHKGTGLGLAIAKGWTEAHGGRLRVASPGLNQGATFVVELPVQKAAEAA